MVSPFALVSNRKQGRQRSHHEGGLLKVFQPQAEKDQPSPCVLGVFLLKHALDNVKLTECVHHGQRTEADERLHIEKAHSRSVWGLCFASIGKFYSMYLPNCPLLCVKSQRRIFLTNWQNLISALLYYRPDDHIDFLLRCLDRMQDGAVIHVPKLQPLAESHQNSEPISAWIVGTF